MKIAAYGTLRGGLHSAKYLTDKYGLDSVKILGDFRLPGFSLYTKLMFGINCPFATPNLNDSIKITLLEISEPYAAQDIDRGESWGYDKIPVMIPGFTKVYLYQSRKKPDDTYTLIPTGDYLEGHNGN